ncbi:MAG: Mur ligase domain-containing protein [Sphaerochaeta sp.]
MGNTATHFFLVGIKGTGMTSLALLLKSWGFSVSGCDTAEVFSSDAILLEAGIISHVGFADSLLPPQAEVVIYSSAYTQDLPILRAARERSLPLYSYPEYLSFLSRKQDSYAVAGTHGKTTTCSVASHLLQHAMEGEFPFYALYGAPQKMQTCKKGCALFEACEYQDHFLSYQLRGVLVTSIEYDHPDYFSSLNQVEQSFRTLVDRLQSGGFLIYCSDDSGARSLGSYAEQARGDLTIIRYGFSSKGPFRIIPNGKGAYTLSLLKDIPFTVTSHARALVADHVGALVLSLAMVLDQPNPKLHYTNKGLITDEVLPTLASLFLPHLSSYTGCRARTEELFREGGVIYLDDYAHHPTEIETSLEELKKRYPSYSLLVLFSSHTASRTKALLRQFAFALSKAGNVIIQKTYVSARGDGMGEEDPARELFALMKKQMGEKVVYAEEDEEAALVAASWLQERWLCITMGAGNNRSCTYQIAEIRRSHS